MTPTDPIEPRLDTLSALGRKLIKIDYQTSYRNLVVNKPGNPNARTVLESISSRDLIDGPVHSQEDADALLSGLWLRFDWLDESHQISQRIESPIGALWHA